MTNSLEQQAAESMMAMSLERIAQAVNGRLVIRDSHVDTRASRHLHVVTDSRECGPDSLFVAIAGERTDGHHYVPVAYQQGATVAIVEHECDSEIAQIVVENSVAALGRLAQANIRARRAYNADFQVIAITGSVGKTTTKDMLSAILSSFAPTVAPVGSFNNEIGLPLTALRVNEQTRYLVAEMGANHIGEIAYLTSLVPPDIAVELKVGVAHLGEFGSPEKVQQAKSELILGLRESGISVLNADDARVSAMSKLAQGDVVWFGLEEHLSEHEAHAQQFWASDIITDERNRTSFILHTSCDEQQKSMPVTLGISGAHNVMNALAALRVSAVLGLPLEHSVAALEQVHTISPHRMQISQVQEGNLSFTFIDDSFNANPDSMRAALQALASMYTAKNPQRIAVLGAMLELGSDSIQLHRQIGYFAASLGIDALIGVGGGELETYARAIIEGAQQWVQETGRAVQVVYAPSAQKAEEEVRGIIAGSAVASSANNQTARAMTLVLLKGSHASGLSGLAQRWQQEKQE